jgi:transglutaminase-like putative cysteine protease
VSGELKAKSPSWIVVACLVIGVSLLFFVWQKIDNNFGQPEAFSKTVSYRFLVRNTTNQPVPSANFFVHAPLNQTGTQRCLRIESSHPYEIITDSPAGPLLRFTFENFPPYASKTISIRATLSLDAAPIKIAETDDPRRFAVALSDSDAQAVAIRQLANGLKTKNVSGTAANLYRWVADNINYTGYSSRAKGASRTFSNRQGDCTEFADLFVALARAADIPARRVSGYLAGGSGLLKPEAYHDWAEFYDNGVWRIADPQQRNFDARYTHYIAMQKEDHSPPVGPMGGFYRFYVDGEGLEVKMDS